MRSVVLPQSDKAAGDAGSRTSGGDRLIFRSECAPLRRAKRRKGKGKEGGTEKKKRTNYAELEHEESRVLLSFRGIHFGRDAVAAVSKLGSRFCSARALASLTV